ncbi:MAG: glycoside hydrolase family 3 N-terminal domain-containing protein [Thermomicrobiales bacterium]
MSNRDDAGLVGQSMMFRFPGPVFTDEARAVFAEIRPCGVLYFADNITSREQVHALSTELQAEAKRLGMPPLLIAIDQEGGIVSRFSPDMVTVPGAMALTANGDSGDIRASARITGEQLAAVGINTDFAPVVDVNNNPLNPVIRTRSFGDTVERVNAGALATIAGLTDAGIISTVKHFPGHGDTAIDSHLGLPIIDHPRDRLDRIELAPFRAAIAAGVPAVMSSHILFPALDQDPATLSHAILTGVLRDDLGFEGVVFTDSLSMDAIEDRYGHGDAAVRCKLAGVDVLEANESIANQLTRFRALVEALEEGNIPRQVFAATASRIERLRERFAVGYGPRPLGDPDPSWSTEAQAIAVRTIAVLPPAGFKPIPRDEPVGFVDFQRLRASEAEDPFNRAGVFKNAITAALPAARVVSIGHSPNAAEIERASRLAETVSTLVIMTRDATDNAYQVDISREVLRNIEPGTRIVHVVLRGPYDRGVLGAVDATILTFGDPAVTLRALASILAGSSPITASLPVQLEERIDGDGRP